MTDRIARLATGFAAAVLVLLSAGGCKQGTGTSPSGYHGAELPVPLEKPDAVLRDTEGRPFDLRADTDGYATALFFGYTNCPDVCPVHMANLAAVLRDAPPSTRSKVKVVFVTVDPERDTPERLRTWLNAFDSTFVGIAGPEDEVARLQKGLYLANAYTNKQSEADSAYDVMHAAQVIVFSRSDNLAHVMYPFGTRQKDWAADLPRLVKGSWW